MAHTPHHTTPHHTTPHHTTPHHTTPHHHRDPTEEDPARYVVDVKLRNIIPRKYFRKELGLQMFSKPTDVRLRARNVVMAAGAVGTNRLLLAMQQDELGLPELPECLGAGVRANHTASYLVNPLDDSDEGTPEGRDFARGISTTSYLKARGTTGGETHTVEVQHFGPRSSFSRFSYLPSVEGGSAGARLVAVLWYAPPTLPSTPPTTRTCVHTHLHPRSGSLPAAQSRPSVG